MKHVGPSASRFSLRITMIITLASLVWPHFYREQVFGAFSRVQLELSLESTLGSYCVMLGETSIVFTYKESLLPFFHNKTPPFAFANCPSTSQWERHSWFHGEQVSLFQTPGHSYWFGVDGPPQWVPSESFDESIFVTQIREMFSPDTWAWKYLSLFLQPHGRILLYNKANS